MVWCDMNRSVWICNNNCYLKEEENHWISNYLQSACHVKAVTLDWTTERRKHSWVAKNKRLRSLELENQFRNFTHILDVVPSSENSGVLCGTCSREEWAPESGWLLGTRQARRGAPRWGPPGPGLSAPVGKGGLRQAGSEPGVTRSSGEQSIWVWTIFCSVKQIRTF